MSHQNKYFRDIFEVHIQIQYDTLPNIVLCTSSAPCSGINFQSTIFEGTITELFIKSH